MRDMQAFINKAQFIRFVAGRGRDRGLNKGELFNSRNPSREKRRDERDRGGEHIYRVYRAVPGRRQSNTKFFL